MFLLKGVWHLAFVWPSLPLSSADQSRGHLEMCPSPYGQETNARFLPVHSSHLTQDDTNAMSIWTSQWSRPPGFIIHNVAMALVFFVLDSLLSVSGIQERKFRSAFLYVLRWEKDRFIHIDSGSEIIWGGCIRIGKVVEWVFNTRCFLCRRISGKE